VPRPVGCLPGASGFVLFSYQGHRFGGRVDDLYHRKPPIVKGQLRGYPKDEGGRMKDEADPEPGGNDVRGTDRGTARWSREPMTRQAKAEVRFVVSGPTTSTTRAPPI
jgi:hypothetical protein